MKKRAFDIVVICLAAVVWVPVVALSAVAVLVLSGRPIFYRSRRWVGPGTAIEMVKLRVMVPNANKVTAPVEAGRFLNTPPDSPLYTPIGRLLDRLGLNEIPQFIHVLRGDMSIVGARPLTDVVRDALSELHGDIDSRWVTPAGLTGLPQLIGRHGVDDQQRLALESAYSLRSATAPSLRLDFMILLHTVLITFGLRKPMSYEKALRMAQPRHHRLHAPELAHQRYVGPAEADVA
ncbi:MULTISPECIES: sugar transferase [unclassified Nocardioides]|uniref:sugar transferase n=1 Tax=unclassified Nocardioides TaxID=2615069 RepID=UPI00116CC33F|nr:MULTISPECIES: sugar transferase [unclassified Nocardioides]TQK69416.1 lipopolysaccharide/colanic/teichoic acid biosynthesis glycosyltransferase [Nocardioides sp. SLBN-35]WGY01285.1 sugar transferase [Nocardioides sp. QY071]